VSTLPSLLATFTHPTSLVDTYITGTPCRKVILYLTDAIGHKFINAQILADGFAAAGYYVIMPDIFNGDPWVLPPPEGATIQGWLENHMPKQTMPIVDAVLNGIKTELKPEKIGAVGYCFGAKYVTRLLAGGVDAGFNAHPSLVTIEELAAIKGPMSIAAAGEFLSAIYQQSA
jgi:dienelactone hydrolase